MTSTTIHFVRHGKVYNPEGIFYARLPGFRLAEEGIQQAEAAAEHLAQREVAVIYSSPLQRAQETAQRIAARHRLPVQTSDLLLEIHTPYEGRLFSEMEAMQWDIYTDIGEQYEQPEHLMARILAFSELVKAQHAGQEVVAVTHGDIVLHAQLWARGLALTQSNRLSVQPYPNTASISTLTFQEGQALPAFRYHEPY